MVGTAWSLVVGSWTCQYDAGGGLWLVVAVDVCEDRALEVCCVTCVGPTLVSSYQ